MNNDPITASPELTLSPVMGRPRDWPERHALDLAQRGALDELRSAIIRGCPFDESDANQSTALHVAARCGHLACIELLLAAGLSSNRIDSAGLTPADLAVREGYPDCANLLRSAESSNHDALDEQERQKD